MQGNQGVYYTNAVGQPVKKEDDGMNQAVALGSGIFVAYCVGISCVIFCCCCVPLIVGIAIGVSNAGGNGNNGELPETVPPSSEEVRNGNDHVGVLFAVEPPAVARDAFVSAAIRWSDIVDGTPITGTNINEGDSPCDGGGLLAFVDDFFLDHLMIISVIDSIDGPGQVLAAAGPCQLQSQLFGNGFPLVGVMIFDSDDINGLLNDGTFETVILHEMGHVLGIGTLWSFARQGEIQGVFPLPDDESLLLDPVNDPFTGITNGFNRPQFVGTNGIAAYQRLQGNQATVPVEDGILDGVPTFNNADGGGSVDGHWNIEDFDNELMVFAIDASNVVFPLSEVTIASLEDLGYTVNLLLADPFIVPNSRKKRLTRKDLESDHVHVLVNDILNIEPVYGD